MEEKQNVKSNEISDNLYITINSFDIVLSTTILITLYLNIEKIENKYLIGINFGVNMIFLIISIISLLTYFMLKKNTTFFHKIYCWTRFIFYSFMMKLAIGIGIYIIYCFCKTMEKDLFRNVFLIFDAILLFIFSLHQFTFTFKLKHHLINLDTIDEEKPLEA